MPAGLRTAQWVAWRDRANRCLAPFGRLGRAIPMVAWEINFVDKSGEQYSTQPKRKVYSELYCTGRGRDGIGIVVVGELRLSASFTARTFAARRSDPQSLCHGQAAT